MAIHSGFRSHELQAHLYEKGRTILSPVKCADAQPCALHPLGLPVTYSKAGESWHNFGVAGDIVFQTEVGKWTWNQDMLWSRLGRIGLKLGLEWGGMWKRIDLPHFQLTGGLTIEDASRYFDQGGFEVVWAEIARRLV